MGGNILRQFNTIIRLIWLFAASLGFGCIPALAELLPENAGHIVAVPILPSDSLPTSQGLESPEILAAAFNHPDRINRFVQYFKAREGHNWLMEGFYRSEPFRDFIQATLSSYRMPAELYYVAMIESTFEVQATSSSGAAGMWQFMLNSIGNWMHSNEWVDERFDFWASTQGALKKLQENYQELGDWTLALAAYNAGLGRISRLVKKTGAKNFWDIADDPGMPAETRAYVPRILAAARIGNQAVRNGLPVFWETPIEWCKVGITRPVSISRLEEAAQVPRGVLKIGNAELRFDLTPPGKFHYLKVPRRYVDSVMAALASEQMIFDFATHVVAKGDTLFGLSRKYQTNMALITSYNPGLSQGQLRIGQKLIIPLVPLPISAETASRGAGS